MKIRINEDGDIVISEICEGVLLESETNKIKIVERDGGFEQYHYPKLKEN